MTRPRLHSHYDTLRVERGASADGVRTAYRRLAQKFHPDKHQGRSAAALVMAQINQAYEVLSDPAQRSAYDEWLASEDARLAGRGADAVVFTPDRFGWGAWLVWATASLAVLTVGYVVIATWAPAPAAVRPAAQAQVPQRAQAQPAAGDTASAQPAPAPRPAKSL
ncbi:J domain-containing protein [Ramlibacter sp.]|uniref:J domain-containing protein n=1 Tax=Ramlibacter sp. TaxID=1917967 RepID=UPI002C445F73|nr:J domain-containing protein [Ramlibacter sp.]HWI81320.1 J domain-containing protein [Ramlibacter sp.]